MALYLAHRVELVKYATTIVGDMARAEDVVQEAWLRFGSATQDRTLDEPLGFLYRIVRNLAIDGRRRLIREALIVAPVELAAAPEAADDHASPEATAASREELVLLQEALAELPERTRIALEMRRFGGFKLREIAAHLGVSVTVAHEIVASGIAFCRQRVRPPS
ncbi:sigma-70 family RNA polymerase sigma factor [Reyranella sp.]|uniref:sigma-70 family RNA polymerase sigma factor n=1 Tax=Reyranella sp. TaxID=1929291 RepID=UPI0025E46739|nr:sigma-70 family RNA polymerase sigma factor [Reyranella sp.]